MALGLGRLSAAPERWPWRATVEVLVCQTLPGRLKPSQQLRERGLFRFGVDFVQVGKPVLEPPLCYFPVGGVKRVLFALATNLFVRIVGPVGWLGRLAQWLARLVYTE